jgi:DNA topoisomerase-1
MMVLKENKKGRLYQCVNKECGGRIEATEEDEGENKKVAAGDSNDPLGAY